MSMRHVVIFVGLLILLTSTTRAENVFLKAFYPLDEPRFLCIDIPGHKSRVNTSRPLSVHTCKEGIWHKDEIFDSVPLQRGHLKMPEFNLCVEATSARDASELVLKTCDQSPLQLWSYQNYRLALKSDPEKCITIGPEPSRLTRGGRRLASKHMARSLSLADCKETLLTRQLWRFEAPQNRSGAIMPFKD
ncbi:MAG: ricin-type beta-trefoil lectin domain protein [Alphaproteobacteria bacterium]